MKILVGLGNPGEKYEQNRHNVGFMAVDAVARRYNAVPWRRRFQGLATEVEIGNVKCLALKPGTYMNESGRAVGEAMRFYKMSPADVIVFHDELDLEPGKIRVKSGGGHAGHNGLRSISGHIGNDYSRVRIGIGHPGSREAVVYYVLHDFSREEREGLDVLLPAIAGSVPHLVAGEDARFMNEIARICRPLSAKVKPEPEPGKIDTPAPRCLPDRGQPEPATDKPERKPQPELAAAEPAKAPAAKESKETSLGAKLRGWLHRR